MFRTLTLSALLLAGAAHAQDQMAVTAWTDLNLRAGPGPAYPIVAVIPAQTAVDVGGCLAELSTPQAKNGLKSHNSNGRKHDNLT